MARSRCSDDICDGVRMAFVTGVLQLLETMWQRRGVVAAELIGSSLVPRFMDHRTVRGHTHFVLMGLEGLPELLMIGHDNTFTPKHRHGCYTVCLRTLPLSAAPVRCIRTCPRAIPERDSESETYSYYISFMTAVSLNQALPSHPTRHPMT